jgi:hypothetical protein
MQALADARAGKQAHTFLVIYRFGELAFSSERDALIAATALVDNGIAKYAAVVELSKLVGFNPALKEKAPEPDADEGAEG